MTTTNEDLRKLDAEIEVKLNGWRYGKCIYNDYYFAYHPDERLLPSYDDVADIVGEGPPWEFWENAAPSTATRRPAHYSTDRNATAVLMAEMAKQPFSIPMTFYEAIEEALPPVVVGTTTFTPSRQDVMFAMWKDPAIICRAALQALEAH